MARMQVSTVRDYRGYSPFRTFDWRWRCAVDYVHSGCSPDEEDDQTVQAAAAYLRKFQAAGTLSQKLTVQRKYPILVAAMNLNDACSPRTWELRARLLTDQTDEQIAQSTGLDLRVVDLFERLFFDVKRHGKLCGLDWILSNLFAGFDPHAEAPEPLVWMVMALGGGTPVLNLLMGDYLGRPEPQHPNRRQLAQLARLLTREHGAFRCGQHELSARLMSQCYELVRDRIDLQSDANRLLPVQLGVLRMVAKLPSVASHEDASGPSTQENARETQAASTDHRNPPGSEGHPIAIAMEDCHA